MIAFPMFIHSNINLIFVLNFLFSQQHQLEHAKTISVYSLLSCSQSTPCYPYIFIPYLIFFVNTLIHLSILTPRFIFLSTTQHSTNHTIQLVSFSCYNTILQPHQNFLISSNTTSFSPLNSATLNLMFYILLKTLLFCV